MNSTTKSEVTPISVSINDAAKLIGGNRNDVYNLIAAGELETAVLGRRRLIFIESLRKAMTRRMSAAPVSSALSEEMARRARLPREPRRLRQVIEPTTGTMGAAITPPGTSRGSGRQV